MNGWSPIAIDGAPSEVFVHNRTMTSGDRFIARRWEIEYATAWQSWVAGPESSRMDDFRRLAMAVGALTRRWASDTDSASSVVRCLPSTLRRCNELAFDTEAETLAYTV